MERRAARSAAVRRADALSARLARLAGALAILAAFAADLSHPPTGPRGDAGAGLTLMSLALPQQRCPSPELCVTAAWQLDSANPQFGSYSALAFTPAGTLRAFSDRGAVLEFAAPPQRGPALIRQWDARGAVEKLLADIESMEIAPDGTQWLAYEGRAAIARRRPGEGSDTLFAVPAMGDWPANRGAEAMVRLADGRLIVVSENVRGASAAALLLTPRDGRLDAVRFRYVPPPGFRATGAALLPDGKVLVLLRALRVMPPGFIGKIAIADPQRIEPDGVWRGRDIGTLSAPLPTDNFEGIAVRAIPGGTEVWLVSDDNDTMVQRTLLLRLLLRDAH